MKKYRVEFRISTKDYFRKNCFENELKKSMELMKEIKNKEGKGKSFYIELPITKNKKIYF